MISNHGVKDEQTHAHIRGQGQICFGNAFLLVSQGLLIFNGFWSLIRLGVFGDFLHDSRKGVLSVTRERLGVRRDGRIRMA